MPRTATYWFNLKPAFPGSEGFPETPWFTISTGDSHLKFLEWLRDLDPCRNDNVVDLILQCRPSGPPPVWAEAARRLRHMAAELDGTRRELPVTCACDPACGARPIRPMPEGVGCQLSFGPGRSTWSTLDGWAFDATCYAWPAVLAWMAVRIDEFAWHHALQHRRAEFPPEIGPADPPAFGPVPWDWDWRTPSAQPGSSSEPTPSAATPSGAEAGLVIQLLGHEWPEPVADMPLRRKWLSYLHRETPPEYKVMDFPPLSCSLLTIMDAPGFGEDAAMALWGTYLQCEIRVTPLGGWAACGLERGKELADDEPLWLKGINGVTIAFLALPTLAARRKLLQMWRPCDLTLQDLERCQVLWLLPQSVGPPSRRSSTDIGDHRASTATSASDGAPTVLLSVQEQSSQQPVIALLDKDGE